MPSSYSPLLRLTLPADGELTGSWGQAVNTGITGLLDSAVAGTLSIALPDADYTLTTSQGAADQARYAALIFTGTLTAPRNVICPASSKTYVVRNSATQNVTVKTPTGTGVTLKPGASAVLWCDATNVTHALSALGPLSLNGAVLSDLGTPVAGTDAATKAYADALSFATALPAQAGNAGNDLATDGTTASWSRRPRRLRALGVLSFIGF